MLLHCRSAFQAELLALLDDTRYTIHDTRCAIVAHSELQERQKQEETKQEYEHALVAYRRGLLDYTQTVTRMHSERKHRIMRQLLGFWLASRSQTKSVDNMQADLEPLVRNVMHQLDTDELQSKVQLAAALEERQALEETDDFNHGHVTATAAASCQGEKAQGFLSSQASFKICPF